MRCPPAFKRPQRSRRFLVRKTPLTGGTPRTLFPFLVIKFASADPGSLSKFAELHPGGAGVLLAREIAGQDASEPFFSLHRSDVLTKYDRLRIGRLAAPSPAASDTAPTSRRKEYLLPVDGELSPVPHAEPDWLHPKLFSPYYSPSHRDLQHSMREFFDSRVRAEAQEFELSGERPTRKLVELMGTPEWDIHAMRMGPGRHLHGKTLPGGVRGEEFDYFVRAAGASFFSERAFDRADLFPWPHSTNSSSCKRCAVSELRV